MVDTAYFEGNAIIPSVLRAVKNRFGSTNEIFEMQTGGLVRVLNPSHRFLLGRNASDGSCTIADLS